jgi:hypothetical protein
VRAAARASPHDPNAYRAQFKRLGAQENARFMPYLNSTVFSTSAGRPDEPFRQIPNPSLEWSPTVSQEGGTEREYRSKKRAQSPLQRTPECVRQKSWRKIP